MYGGGGQATACPPFPFLNTRDLTPAQSKPCRIRPYHGGMRIVKDTEEQFILEERPVFWGFVLIFFAMATSAWAFNAIRDRDYAMAGFSVLATIGICYFAYMIVERVWLVLDRRSNLVELRRRNHRRSRSQAFPLSELKPDGVLVERSDDMHRIALKFVSQDSPVPMTRHYQTGNHIHRCAEAARVWLKAAE